VAFKLAQTFYVDKTAVMGAEHVAITSIDLYFKAKPRQTGNRSGINSPGVTLVLMETQDNDVPSTTRTLNTGVTRVEYANIYPTNDASVSTNFLFTTPPVIDTNKSYALGVMFDGNEDFELWTCKAGDVLVGTNTTTSGATARYVGSYYEFSSTSTTLNTGTIQELWKPLNNTDLKFSLYIGAYGTVSANTTVNSTWMMASNPQEFIAYDKYHDDTANHANAAIGEMIFQETPISYGNIQIKANSAIITAGNTINFSTLVKPSENLSTSIVSNTVTEATKSYIVLRDGSGDSANVNVREVKRVISNTQIEVDRLPTFTNNTATFSITAAGRLSNKVEDHSFSGRWFDQSTTGWEDISGYAVPLLTISDSNANSTLRFVNNYVLGITINSGGTGYSNSDVITVYPVTNANTANVSHIAYLPSYANGVANVVTNGSGTITGLAITNKGFGLAANVQYTITTSGGTSANLTVSVGSKLRTEQSDATFGNTVVANIPVHAVVPHTLVVTNQHHEVEQTQHLSYYVEPGKEHIPLQANVALNLKPTEFAYTNVIDSVYNDGRAPALLSRSNEVMANNVQITLSTGATVNTGVKASSLIEMSVQSNNVFSVPVIITDDVYTYKNLINNTTAGEHKGPGAALARSVSKKVTFIENRNAEDIVVILDAHRPTGTNIDVYVRILNKSDSDAFDDKDWTKLQITSNNALSTSSLTNENDVIEFTYGLKPEPDSVYTANGSVTITDVTSANVAGVGTSFVTDIVAHDVVKIYSPLFPENYVIRSVSSVTNTSQIILSEPVAYTSMVGSGLKIDLIGRPASGANNEIGTPFQAWTEPNEDGVINYFNSDMARFKTYNTFAIKMVLTSSNPNVSPKINNIRAVGVSA
jgi:hypothetical protein